MQLCSYFTPNLGPIQSVGVFRSFEHILGVQVSCFNINSGNLKVYKNFNISIERITTSSANINVSNTLYFVKKIPIYGLNCTFNHCARISVSTPHPQMLILSVNMPGQIKNDFVTNHNMAVKSSPF